MSASSALGLLQELIGRRPGAAASANDAPNGHPTKFAGRAAA
ncbi:hypothetical protein [Mycobacterium rhizamassiliense]|nr:hypothetical protein [Mycobacterium rhizamassiliense]